MGFEGARAKVQIMAIDGNDASPEREQTDESLRIEREKTDLALAESVHMVSISDTGEGSTIRVTIPLASA
jgi:hypothetical protein